MVDTRREAVEDEQYQLRLIASELAALQTDWAQVAGPAPGHDFRRAIVRARDAIDSARAALASGRPTPSDWAERARGHLRTARRLLVQRQIAYFGHWWPSERRYLD